MELSPALRAAIALFATSPAAAPAFLRIYSTSTATSNVDATATATATADGQPQQCTHLHVLDSSFNPPTTAHLALARSSLAAPSPPPRPPTNSSSPPSRRLLLLLLSAHNADKPAGPATLLERLEMMHRLSLSLGPQLPPDVGVDIGLTKHARFVDKSQALAAAYPPAQLHYHHHHHHQTQTFLVGFDTLVRLLDPKYYPPLLHSPCSAPAPLAALQPFFARARVCCMLRGEDVPAQHAYLERIRRGERLAEGCQPTWAACIELVDAPAETVGVSSSLVRDTLRSRSGQGLQQPEVVEVLQRRLTPEVAAYVLRHGLYLDG